MNISSFLPNKSISPDIDQFIPSNAKEVVFFDELVKGYIILETQDVKSQDLAISLDICIIPGDNDDINVSNFSILTMDIDKLVNRQGDKLIYEFETPINYPKKKLNNPKIIFHSFVKLKSNPNDDIELDNNNNVLKPFEPIERNLLSELTTNNQHYQLTLQKSNPQVNHDSQVPPAEDISSIVSSKLQLPIITPLLIKLKSTKPAGKNNILLTSFSIESSESLLKLGNNLNIEISKFNISFKGNLENLNILTFPLSLLVHEPINLNYKLINLTEDYTKQLNIEIRLKIFNNDTQKMLSNEINTTWLPIIDFNLIAPPINNSLKTTPSSLLLPKKRSPTLPKATTSMAKTKLSSHSSVTVNLTGNPNSNLFGLKLSFIGKLNVNIGEIVTWHLQAINSSFNKLNLSLILNRSNEKHDSNFAVSKDIVPTYTKLQLFQIYSSIKLHNHGVIILDNDIRLPLEPNSVFETTIKLMGVSKGIYNLDGLNVYDLNTGDCLDFGKLVEVFVT